MKSNPKLLVDNGDVGVPASRSSAGKSNDWPALWLGPNTGLADRLAISPAGLRNQLVGRAVKVEQLAALGIVNDQAGDFGEHTKEHYIHDDDAHRRSEHHWRGRSAPERRPGICCDLDSVALNRFSA